MRIYTDGAARGNGAAVAYCGWGVCWQASGAWETRHGGARDVTNNVMELEAMYQGLVAVSEQGVPAAVLVSDSQYVIKGLNEWLPGWIRNNWRTAAGKPVANVEQWKRLVAIEAALRARGVKLTFEWVRGHNGDPGNELADQLANQGADSVADPVAAAKAVEVSSGGQSALYRAGIAWNGIEAGRSTATCAVAATSSEDAESRIRMQLGTAFGDELTITVLEVVPGGVVFINKNS